MTGKVVLVTGAARRIGRAIALRLAAEGARVAIHYQRSETEARRTAEECGGAELFRANLESVAEIAGMFAAHRGAPGPPGRPGQQRRALHPLRPARDHRARLGFHPLRQSEGRLLLLPERRAADAPDRAAGGSSTSARWAASAPGPEHAHYCASKAGVIMLTRALAKAWAPAITVNSVAPGVIPFDDIDERGRRMIASTPARRGGTPEEIADAVVYLPARRELRHRADAGRGWRPEPAVVRRRLREPLRA